jgi:hypothetical protein
VARIAQPAAFAKRRLAPMPIHSKMGQTANQRKFLSIKVKDGIGRALKNVLTEKIALFWRLLAEKRGGRALKMTLFFVFFLFLRLFSRASC